MVLNFQLLTYAYVIRYKYPIKYPCYYSGGEHNDYELLVPFRLVLPPFFLLSLFQLDYKYFLLTTPALDTGVRHITIIPWLDHGEVDSGDNYIIMF